MPSFLVIAVFVFLIHWLGWWLLAIVIGLVASFFLWIWWGTRKIPNSDPFQQAAPVEHGSQEFPSRTIRIELTSTYESQSRPSSSQQPVSSQKSPMTALIIRDVPLEQILAGVKIWEMRTNHTRKRGTIALAKKGTGHIFGVADIVDSRGPLSLATMMSTVAFHRIDPSRIDDAEVAKYRHAWVLANVQRLRRPVPYSHTKGAQSFVALDADTASAVVRAAYEP